MLLTGQNVITFWTFTMYNPHGGSGIVVRKFVKCLKIEVGFWCLLFEKLQISGAAVGYRWNFRRRVLNPYSSTTASFSTFNYQFRCKFSCIQNYHDYLLLPSMVCG